MKKNVLIFPCGSEIGLEIYRSLKYSIHFNLIGASSISDHGRFVYENYIPGLPFADDDEFIEKLNQVIATHKIHLLYLTMDAVINKVAQHKDKVNCLVIGSPAETCSVCSSKKKTTALLSSFVDMPTIFDKQEDIKSYPVFLKPDVGYSGRNTKIAHSKEDVAYHLGQVPGCLVMEYLPGEEYTIDCFTSYNRELLFSGARMRKRISNGISVNTMEADEEINSELKKISVTINEKMHFRGAWFYQVKRSEEGKLKVMEVAARLGGSSALFRAKGINFASLTLWDAIGTSVAIVENNYSLEMDRALDHAFKINIEYSKVFVDLDDTLIINKKVNIELLAFLFQCRNEGKELVCISRHAENIHITLADYKLNNIFDRVIHLSNAEPKSLFIEPGAIFIDDSFAERQEVASLNIPVFSPEMVAALIK